MSRRFDVSPSQVAEDLRDASENVPFATKAMGNTVEVPIEIWWHILDYYRDDWSVLLNCALVCRTWHDRAQQFLPKGDEHVVCLANRKEVVLLAHCFRVRELDTRAVRVCGDDDSKSLAHLVTLVAMLSGKLDRLEELHLFHGVWKAASINDRVLSRCLLTFTAIQCLRLHDVLLPSTTTLAGLIRAIPRLTSLELTDVSTRSNGVSHAEPCSREPLDRLVLNCSDVDGILCLLEGMGMRSTVVALGLHFRGHDTNDFRRCTEHVRLLRNIVQDASADARLTLSFHGARPPAKVLGELVTRFVIEDIV